MRKMRIFLIELLLVPLLVGWLLVRAPEMFDGLMPWIVTAIAWHLAYEWVWNSDSIKGWRTYALPSQKDQVALFIACSVALCLSVWFGSRGILQNIAKSSPAVVEHQPQPPTPTPTPSVITQTATASDCSNIIAKDLKLKCQIEKEKEKEKKHEDAKP